ncbi:MAG: hypothetical protein AAF805_09135 [Planctomycetota bacterium]
MNRTLAAIPALSLTGRLSLTVCLSLLTAAPPAKASVFVDFFPAEIGFDPNTFEAIFLGLSDTPSWFLEFSSLPVTGDAQVLSAGTSGPSGRAFDGSFAGAYTGGTIDIDPNGVAVGFGGFIIPFDQQGSFAQSFDSSDLFTGDPITVEPDLYFFFDTPDPVGDPTVDLGAVGLIGPAPFQAETDGQWVLRAAEIPEPAAAVLLAIGCGLLALRSGR